jgi:hypothetical protein
MDNGVVLTYISVYSGGVLAHSFEDLFAKKASWLAHQFRGDYPEYGKDIACVFVGNTSEEIIRKVEKSL